MSYKIQYTSVGPDMPAASGKRKWVILSSVILLAAMLASNILVYPWLEKIVLPKGSSVMESLEVAVAQLQEGSAFSDAVTAFCRDVIFNVR